MTATRRHKTGKQSGGCLPGSRPPNYERLTKLLRRFRETFGELVSVPAEPTWIDASCAMPEPKAYTTYIAPDRNNESLRILVSLRPDGKLSGDDKIKQIFVRHDTETSELRGLLCEEIFGKGIDEKFVTAFKSEARMSKWLKSFCRVKIEAGHHPGMLRVRGKQFPMTAIPDSRECRWLKAIVDHFSLEILERNLPGPQQVFTRALNSRVVAVEWIRNHFKCKVGISEGRPVAMFFTPLAEANWITSASPPRGSMRRMGSGGITVIGAGDAEAPCCAILLPWDDIGFNEKVDRYRGDDPLFMLLKKHGRQALGPLTDTVSCVHLVWPQTPAFRGPGETTVYFGSMSETRSLQILTEGLTICSPLWQNGPEEGNGLRVQLLSGDYEFSITEIVKCVSPGAPPAVGYSGKGFNLLLPEEGEQLYVFLVQGEARRDGVTSPFLPALAYASVWVSKNKSGEGPPVVFRKGVPVHPLKYVDELQMFVIDDSVSGG